jgi:hypothetical protein
MTVVAMPQTAVSRAIACVPERVNTPAHGGESVVRRIRSA